MERSHPTQRLADALTAVAFTATIAAPLAVWVATGEPDRSIERELRTLGPSPTLAPDPATLEAFRLDFPDWYDDAFRLRGTLVRWNNLVKLAGLGVSPSDEVVVGEDGWLFYGGDRALDGCRGLDPFTEQELEHWRTAFEERRDWLAARDVDFLVAIAPDKHTVYPELLPAAYRVPAAVKRLEQLTEFMARTSDVRMTDLGPRLREAASRSGRAKPVYFPHGTHWNDRGSLIAYQAILEALPPELGLGAPWSAADFREVDPSLLNADWVGDTWAEQFLIEDVVRQETMIYEPVEPERRRALPVEYHVGPSGQMDGVMAHPDTALPRIVLFRDSFANWLFYFLAEHASRLAVDSASRFDPALVAREGADLVICQFVERKLMTVRPRSGVDAVELGQARRWLAGSELELEPGGQRASVAGPIATGVLVRVRFEAGAAGRLALRWRDSAGASQSREHEVAGERDWVFLEVEGPASDLELDWAGLESRVLEIRGRAVRDE